REIPLIVPADESAIVARAVIDVVDIGARARIAVIVAEGDEQPVDELVLVVDVSDRRLSAKRVLGGVEPKLQIGAVVARQPVRLTWFELGFARSIGFANSDHKALQ